MPEYTNRHLFRMTDYRNIERFLQDGALYAKNYHEQPQYSISYEDINNKRQDVFKTPDDESLHDYLPFYFSPITAMAYAIHCGNVSLRDECRNIIGSAKHDEVVYVVSSVDICLNANIPFWFTNVACNTPGMEFENDIEELDTHIHWRVFDEQYGVKAVIPEIGYKGVCGIFQSREDQAYRRNRSAERMAEFMVRDALPLGNVICIVTKNHTIKVIIDAWMQESEWDIPVYVKVGCYF